jgi:hypothetical protein
LRYFIPKGKRNHFGTGNQPELKKLSDFFTPSSRRPNTSCNFKYVILPQLIWHTYSK